MSTDAAANEDVSITLQHNHWDGTKNRHEVTIASVEALQAKAVEITGIPVAQLVLQVGGRKLWVGRPLAKQGVVENTVVTVEDRDGWQHKHGELQKALYDAIQADNGDEAVRLLTEQNADPNTPQAPNGYGPAHFAAMRSSVRPLNALCDAGANVNQSYEDLGGGTVLQFAVQNFDHDPELGLSMTEALCFPPPDALPGRSKVTSRDVLGAALGFATARGMAPIVAQLLRAGADPDYYPEHDDYAFTPLIGLIYENEQHPSHAQIANMLLQAGANPKHIGRSHTALGYARDYKRQDLIPILQNAERNANH